MGQTDRGQRAGGRGLEEGPAMGSSSEPALEPAPSSGGLPSGMGPQERAGDGRSEKRRQGSSPGQSPQAISQEMDLDLPCSRKDL